MTSYFLTTVQYNQIHPNTPVQEKIIYSKLYILYILLSLSKIRNSKWYDNTLFFPEKVRGRSQINSISSIESFGERRPRPNYQPGPIGIDLIRPNKAGERARIARQFTNARNSWRHQTAYPTLPLTSSFHASK